MDKKRPREKKAREKISRHLIKGDIEDIWGRKKWKNLFAHVDISSLVFFRIFFGLVMLVEVYRYFDKGWIQRYWITPKHHFTQWPFDFLSPLPGEGMYILFLLMGVLAICITVGLFYRISMLLFFICFTYMFLLEQTRYLNHFYLIILFSFVMIFIPAHRAASADAMIFKKSRSETTPAWTLWLVRFMVGIPYFFGGIAKLNSDWLQGQPLSMWLANDTDFPLIGPFFKEKWMILFMSYAGLILDILAVPLLLFKKTRVWGLLSITAFHLMNSELFQIGIFPWFMLGATTIYFSPDWPRKLINVFKKKGKEWHMLLPANELMVAPTYLSGKQKAILIALIIWVAIQVLVPLRHLIYPGNVHWTEEGHKYAWHMKLRTKRGKGVYTVEDKNTGQKQVIDADDYLKKWQQTKMEGNPDLIWQFCQMVKEDYKKKGRDVAIYANVKASLNGRKFQQLIDSTVDLASVPQPALNRAPWIIPLQTPLSDRLKK